MKIKPIINEKDICNTARYNQNTKGTHLFITDGEISEKKQDYSNIVILSLMYKRGFLNSSIDQMESDATTLVDSYEERSIKEL